MTVPDCLSEYRKLGERVFGHPRFFHSIRFGFGSRTKYDSKNLEQVFKDVANERLEEAADVAMPMSPPTCCDT
jgi:hypothetical protein